MDLRMTQVDDRPSMLERFAPGILSGIAMLAAFVMWGPWGLAFSAATVGLYLYREL
jgi:hypothetical protein